MKKLLSALAGVVLLCLMSLTVSAQEVKATEISGAIAAVESTGIAQLDAMFDGDCITGEFYAQNSSVTFADARGFGSLYMIFDLEPGSYTVTDLDNDVSITCGQNDFLHEYVDLESAFGEAPKLLKITFDAGKVRLCEIRLFTPGEVPDDVQIWQKPEVGKADLLLFSTHGDDEQLFFAGIIPYYAGELGYEVVVAYFTSHRPIVYHRTHEMLNGLYGVGLRNYPVFGPFPDYHSLSLEKSYQVYAQNGYRKDAMLSYVVEQLRKFHPKVAVGHDVYGEYGHGAHRMYSELLREGVELAAQENAYPESYEAWGTWDTPKTYLHLYKDNPIVMNWDVPLEHFYGKTAYEVTRDFGFSAHKSQFDDYWWYFDGNPTAASCDAYSPCEYGLFRSLVGPDEEKNDFFENNISYTQELRNAEKIAAQVLQEIEAEEQARQEAELAAAAAAMATVEDEVEQTPEPAEEHLILTAGFLVLAAVSVGVFILTKKRS